jgi:hypothetical protein
VVIQASELIRKCLHLIDMIQQVFTLLHLACEELATNEKDVGQAPCLVDVAQSTPCFHGPFATLDVGKLVIHQFEANNDIAFFTRRLYSFITFESSPKDGGSSVSSTISQRSMDVNTISILNFQRLKFSPLNLSMTLALSPSKLAMFALKWKR